MNDAERIEILLNHVMVINALIEGRTDKVDIRDLRALLRDLEVKDFSLLRKEELVRLAIEALEQLKVVPAGFIDTAIKNNGTVHKASPLRSGPRGKAKSPRARQFVRESARDEEVRSVAREWVKKTFKYTVPFAVAGAMGYLTYKGYVNLGQRKAFSEWLEERDPGFLGRTREALLGGPSEDQLYEEWLASQ